MFNLFTVWPVVELSLASFFWEKYTQHCFNNVMDDLKIQKMVHIIP